MKNFILITILALNLSGCYAAMFGAAATGTVVAAQDKSLGDAIDDTTLWARIQKAFIKEGFYDFFSKINVSAMEGRVMLTGYIADDGDELKAINLIWAQPGVREVINELKVDLEKSKLSAARYAKDSVINNQVKGKALFTKGIKYINYTFVTFDDVVYIFGIARTQDELDHVHEVAASVHGVRKVVSHVRLKDSDIRSKSLEVHKTH
jgi:osmotically-inducible protein OsmY